MKNNAESFTRAAIYLPVAVTCVAVFYFSNCALWTGDDFKFMFIFGPDNFTDRPIETFSDLMVSQKWHWFSENGRLVAHFLVRLFNCFLGQTAFAAANALAWAALIIVSARLAGFREMTAGKVMTATVLMILTFATRMVPSCQIGYIWMFLVTSVWIVMFMSAKSCRGPLSYCLLALFSVLAGNTHEAFNIPVGVAAVIYMIARHKSLQTKQIIMIAGFAAGGLILSLSPAAVSRAEGSTISFSGSVYYLVIFSHTAYIALATALLARYRWGKTWRQIYDDNSFFINASAVSLCFNLMIGITVPRQLFGQEFLFAIIVMRLLPAGTFKKYVNVLLAAVIAVAWFYNYNEINRIRSDFELIKRQALSGVDEIYIDTWNVSDDNLFNYCKEINNTIHYRDEFNIRTINNYLRTINQSVDFYTLPEWLEGKDNVALNDTVIEYHDGAFLIIAKGTEERCISGQRTLFGSLRVPYNSVEINRLPPLKETRLWRAWVVEDIMPGSRFRSFEFERSDSVSGKSKTFVL